MASLLRRLLVFILLAIWWGGLTFYGAIVIHTAVDVLGSHSEVGFITQRVTEWLNWIGVATLAVLAWNLAATWRSSPRWLVAALAVTWLVMAGVEAGLFALHPQLDQLLDVAAQSIRDDDQFLSLHRIYLNATTTQWVAGLLHITCLLIGWRNEASKDG